MTTTAQSPQTARFPPSARRNVNESGRLSQKFSAQAEGARDEIDFTHPSAKVFAFDIPASQSPGVSAGQRHATPLKWRSNAETLEAVGVIKISSGPVGAPQLQSPANKNLQLSMLPGSQWWCLNKESKFATRLRQRVYRVELPFDTPEEKSKVEEFKTVLRKIVDYEKTQCPFEGETPVEVMEDRLSPKARRRLIGRHSGGERAPAYNDLWSRDGSRRSSALSAGEPSDGSDEDGLLETQLEESEAELEETRVVPNSGEREVKHIHESLYQPFNAPLVQSQQGLDNSANSEVKHESPQSTPIVTNHADLEQSQRSATTSSTISEPTNHTQPQTEQVRVKADSAIIASTAPSMADSSSTSEILLPNFTPPSKDSAHENDIDESSSIAQPPLSYASRSILGKTVQKPEQWQEPLRASSTIRRQTLENSQSLESSPAAESSTPQIASAVQPSSTPKSPATTPSTPKNSSPKLHRLTSSPRSSPKQPSSFDDPSDAPTLGIFSQTLNILLGPPSGLLAALVAFARRIGSLRVGSGGDTNVGLGSNVWAINRRMPGYWWEEGDEEGPDTLSDESTDDYGVPLGNGRNGRRKRREWASSSATAGVDEGGQDGLKKREDTGLADDID